MKTPDEPNLDQLMQWRVCAATCYLDVLHNNSQLTETDVEGKLAGCQPQPHILNISEHHTFSFSFVDEAVHDRHDLEEAPVSGLTRFSILNMCCVGFDMIFKIHRGCVRICFSNVKNI